MRKELSAANNIMFWLIVAAAVSALAWAYFMPVEISVAALGQISYLGEPQAVIASHGGTAEAPSVKSFEHVDRGDALIRVMPDSGQTVTVSAPGDGALIWQRGLISGDRIMAGERLAIVYPDEPLGLLIRLSDRDMRKIELVPR